MPLGEADRILTLFTPDAGKVRAVGKGVRRIKSRYGGHLELLNRVQLSISYGRSLDVVNEAQVIESFPALREDLQQLSKAFYLAELVDGFTAEQSQNEPVYHLLLRAFRSLDSAREPGDHLFSCGGGGVVCQRCRGIQGSTLVPLSLSAMKVLRFIQRSADYSLVNALNVSTAVLREIERLTRTHIRFLVERDVKSADFMGLVSSSGRT